MTPVHRATTEIILRNRPRGLLGHVRMVLLQPVLFFRILSVPNPESRMWLWAAVLFVAVVGASAVRQAELRSLPAADAGGSGPILPPSGPGGPIEGGGGFGGGGLPPEGPPLNSGDGTSTSASADIADTLTTALIGASGMVAAWFGLMVMLSLVSLARGLAPSFGTNLQIAIWASAPLLVMAALQLLYYSAGGSLGQEGITGLLNTLPGYETLPPLVREVLYALFARVTLFWVWMLILIYLGARFALRGSRVVAAFVVIVWAVLLIFLPVASGQSKVPEAELPTPLFLPESTPSGFETPPAAPFGE